MVKLVKEMANEVNVRDDHHMTWGKEEGDGVNTVEECEEYH